MSNYLKVGEIDKRFPKLAIPAGLRNLAKSTQIAYREERKRKIEKYFAKNGDFPSENEVDLF